MGGKQYTPEAGGKVDKSHLTQFARAMQQLGIEMIPAYAPEARGRSERALRTQSGAAAQRTGLGRPYGHGGGHSESASK